jgi:hypothetical protein
MKCPHCRITFHEKPRYDNIGKDVDGNWIISTQKCPECNRFIIFLLKAEPYYSGSGSKVVHGVLNIDDAFTIMVRPKVSSRPCPPEVPPDIAKDFKAASSVIADSPEASAAMSRRCLQHLLRDPNAANVKDVDLAREIQKVIASNTLPPYIVEGLHAIRHHGNFGAHPMESIVTGEILPIEPGEAEWNLDVLESLFDFYYVQPTILQKKKDDLNRKLKEAGKKPDEMTMGQKKVSYIKKEIL